MCGIAAVLLFPQQRKQSDWAAIRELFTSNLVFNEERGKEATGCVIVRQSGQARMQKMPISASKFVTTSEYAALLETVDSNTTLILGHTRLPTRGDPAFASNNHPVKAGPVFGVHNGQINNADELFSIYDLPRRGEVDSEIIFRLLETISPTIPVGDYLGAIQPLIRLLDGQFTFLACDQRNPGSLLVLKHDNPLFVHYQPEWKALIFSSRYIFLRKTFGAELAVQTLAPDKLMIFSAETIPELGLVPRQVMPLYAWSE